MRAGSVARAGHRWLGRVRIGSILAVGVAVRVALVLVGRGTDRFLFPDSGSYLIVADALPTGLWDPSAAARSWTLARPPAYPILAALGGGSDHLVAVVLLGCLVGGALTPWLVHRLARRVAGPEVATVAALVAVADPASLGHHLLIASETVAAALVAAAMVAVLAVVDALGEGRSPLPAAFGVGVAASGLALTRPNLVVVAPAAIVLILVAGRRRPRVLLAAGLATAVAVLAIGGWVVRNDRVGGRPTISTVAGQNLRDFGLAATASEAGELPFWAVERDEFDAAVRAAALREGVSPEVEGDTFSAATDERWSAEGLELLRDHPRGAAVVAVQSLLRTAVAPTTDLVVVHLPDPVGGAVDGPARAFGVLWLVGLWGSAALGTVVLARSGRRLELAVLAGTVVLVLATAVGPWMYARFRVPVVPALAVLAGIGTVHLLAVLGGTEELPPVD